MESILLFRSRKSHISFLTTLKNCITSVRKINSSRTQDKTLRYKFDLIPSTNLPEFLLEALHSDQNVSIQPQYCSQFARQTLLPFYNHRKNYTSLLSLSKKSLSIMIIKFRISNSITFNMTAPVTLIPILRWIACKNNAFIKFHCALSAFRANIAYSF